MKIINPAVQNSTLTSEPAHSCTDTTLAVHNSTESETEVHSSTVNKSELQSTVRRENLNYLKSKGVNVLYNVDATNVQKHPVLASKTFSKVNYQ